VGVASTLLHLVRRIGIRGGIGISLVGLTAVGAGLFATHRPSVQPIEIFPPPTTAPTVTPSRSPTPQPIVVDVAGAVVAPGVYQLPPGSRISDAISSAGGPADDADLDRINKAIPLQDGMQVHVPRQSEPGPTPLAFSMPPQASSAVVSEGAGACAVVDLNTATLAELEQLPQIGPARGNRIIQGRPYGAVEDLLRIDGIGPAILEAIRPCVAVR
jgi:competence protein ComEA